MSNCMEICPIGARLIYGDAQMGGRDVGNRHFLRLCESPPPLKESQLISGLKCSFLSTRQYR